MNPSTCILSLCVAAWSCLPSSWADDAAAVPAAPTYESGPTHAGGIGTYYLGREIAQVMGHQAADWLDRKSREHEENPAALVSMLELKADQVAADIGAGTGYYSFRMAPLVARVLAVDIQQEMLDLLDAKAKQLGIVDELVQTPEELIPAARACSSM